MPTVQQISKELIKAGLKKKTVKRIKFQTVMFGDYEANQLIIKGEKYIIIQPVNGMTCERVMQVIEKHNPETKNGLVFIKIN